MMRFKIGVRISIHMSGFELERFRENLLEIFLVYVALLFSRYVDNGGKRKSADGELGIRIPGLLQP